MGCKNIFKNVNEQGLPLNLDGVSVSKLGVQMSKLDPNKLGAELKLYLNNLKGQGLIGDWAQSKEAMALGLQSVVHTDGFKAIYGEWVKEPVLIENEGQLFFQGEQGQIDFNTLSLREVATPQSTRPSKLFEKLKKIPGLPTEAGLEAIGTLLKESGEILFRVKGTVVSTFQEAARLAGTIEVFHRDAGRDTNLVELRFGNESKLGVVVDFIGQGLVEDTSIEQDGVSVFTAESAQVIDDIEAHMILNQIPFEMKRLPNNQFRLIDSVPSSITIGGKEITEDEVWLDFQSGNMGKYKDHPMITQMVVGLILNKHPVFTNEAASRLAQVTTNLTEAESVMKLVKMMERLGLSTLSTAEYMTKFSKRNGSDLGVIGLMDISNKVMAIAEGSFDISTITEELVHFLVETHHDQAAIDAILSEVEGTEQWKEHAEAYTKKYGETMQGEELREAVRREILAKVITDNFLGNDVRNEAYTRSVVGVMAKAFARIRAFFNPNMKKSFNSLVNTITSSIHNLDASQYSGEARWGKPNVYFQIASPASQASAKEIRQVVKSLEATVNVLKRENITTHSIHGSIFSLQSQIDGLNAEAQIQLAVGVGSQTAATLILEVQEALAAGTSVSAAIQSAVTVLETAYSPMLSALAAKNINDLQVEIAALRKKAPGSNASPAVKTAHSKKVKDLLYRETQAHARNLELAELSKQVVTLNTQIAKATSAAIAKVAQDVASSGIVENEQALDEFNAELRDTHGREVMSITSWLGYAHRTPNKVLGVLKQLISKAHHNASILYFKHLQSFTRVLKDLGIVDSAKLEKLLQKDAKGVATGYFRGPIDLFEAEQVREVASLSKVQELALKAHEAQEKAKADYKLAVTAAQANNTPVPTEPEWDAKLEASEYTKIERITHLPDKYRLEYQKAMEAHDNVHYEQRMSDKNRLKQEAFIAGTSLQYQQAIKLVDKVMGQIRSRKTYDANGNLLDMRDRANWTKSDFDKLVAARKNRVDLESAMHTDGTLKEGLTIRPDGTVGLAIGYTKSDLSHESLIAFDAGIVAARKKTYYEANPQATDMQAFMSFANAQPNIQAVLENLQLQVSEKAMEDLKKEPFAVALLSKPKIKQPASAATHLRFKENGGNIIGNEAFAYNLLAEHLNYNKHLAASKIDSKETLIEAFEQLRSVGIASGHMTQDDSDIESLVATMKIRSDLKKKKKNLTKRYTNAKHPGLVRVDLMTEPDLELLKDYESQLQANSKVLGAQADARMKNMGASNDAVLKEFHDDILEIRKTQKEEAELTTNQLTSEIYSYVTDPLNAKLGTIGQPGGIVSLGALEKFVPAAKLPQYHAAMASLKKISADPNTSLFTTDLKSVKRFAADKTNKLYKLSIAAGFSQALKPVLSEGLTVGNAASSFWGSTPTAVYSFEELEILFSSRVEALVHNEVMKYATTTKIAAAAIPNLMKTGLTRQEAEQDLVERLLRSSKFPMVMSAIEGEVSNALAELQGGLSRDINARIDSGSIISSFGDFTVGGASTRVNEAQRTIYEQLGVIPNVRGTQEATLSDVQDWISEKHDLGIMAIKPASTWNKEDAESTNPNYSEDWEGGAKQPKQAKYIDKGWFNHYGIPLSEFSYDKKLGDYKPTKNKEDFRALLVMVETKAEIDKLYELGGRRNAYRMPQESKSFVEKAHDSRTTGLNNTRKNLVKDALSYRVDDKIGGESVNGVSLADGGTRVVPRYYVESLEERSDLSLDVMNSMSKMLHQAYVYQGRKTIEGSARALESAMSTKSYGRKYRAGAVDGNVSATKSFQESNIGTQTREMINATVYGVRQNTTLKTEILGIEVDLAKVALKIERAAGTLNLGANAPIAATQFATGVVNFDVLERFTGEFFSADAYANANKQFLTLSKAYAQDFGVSHRTSKLGQMADHFGATDAQERMSNSRYGRAGRLLNSPHFALQSLASMPMDGRIMLAALNDYRQAPVLDAQGNPTGEIKFVTYNQFKSTLAQSNQGTKATKAAWKALSNKSLYEALESFEGNIRLKPEIASQLSNDPALVEQMEQDLMVRARQKVGDLLSSVNSSVSMDNQNRVSRNGALKLLTTHATWMYLAGQKRFNAEFYNMQTQQYEEGHYLTVAKVGSTLVKQLVKGHIKTLSDVREVFDTLEPHQQRNVGRALLEHTLIITMFALGTLLMGYADDEENKDDALTQFLALIFLRTLTEVQSSTPVLGIMGVKDYIEKPMVAMNVVNQVMDLPGYSTDLVTSGMYKGETKLWRKMMKLSWGKNIYNMANLKEYSNSYRYFNASSLMHLSTPVEKRLAREEAAEKFKAKVEAEREAEGEE